ncbi:MAG: superoxide dismutase family protein [Gammaproteobacteria bacterium]|nr:superoxide dismutase family protein [Gammaproteobacteria bacterium]MDE0270849.1 superoxide dismutase family protein [Gammaproteobacteria bacterium]
MKIIATACAAFAAVLASATVSAADVAGADILDAEGSVVGKARFEQTPTGVLMFVDVAGLPPGAHGIHLHGTGACAPDFKAAKGHVNPDQTPHGLRNPDGPDNGDLPNLYVAADGSAKAEFFTTRVSVAQGSTPALLDEDGSAVIIHDQPDDHMTQPIGGAGGRIGCGIIKKI